MQGDRVSTRTIHAGAASLAVLAALFLAGPAAAQPQLGSLTPTPRLNVLTPTGGKAGTNIDVTLNGTDLNGPEAILFSHPGIKGTLLDAVVVPPDPKIKPKGGMKQVGTPTASKFSVKIGSDVPPGDTQEVQEKEPNNDVDQAQRIDLGTTINGTINAPTDVDYYVFTAKKGQRVVVSLAGPTIDSRINPDVKVFDAAGREVARHRPPPNSDALADFTAQEDGDYFVRLCQFTYTLGGPEYFYRLSVSTAPWIDAVMPPMIEPGKTSKVTLYGRNLPGGKLDPTAVIDGRALETLVVDVTAPNDPIALQRLGYGGHVTPATAGIDGFEYRLKTPAGSSNAVPLFFARAPVVLESQANDTQETAQEIVPPCEVAGRIEKKRDRDWYYFSAKKDTVYTIEVQSQRLGAPTDMFLIVYNATGKQVTEMAQLDDDPPTALLSPTRFYSLTRDPPAYRFVAPADGKYYLLLYSHLGDTHFGPEHVYRVRVAPEQPDFRLVIMPPDTYRPDTCIVGQGGQRDFTVFAYRYDGFKGEIALTVEGLPSGVTCKPQTLGPGRKQSNLVVSAAPNAANWAGEIKVKGTAIIRGQKVMREARSATITWPVPPQQNIPAVTRLDRTLVMAVRGKAPYSLTLAKDSATVSLGDKVAVPVKLTRGAPDFKSPVNITPLPLELPPGVTFQPINLAGKDEGTLTLNVAGNVLPGTYNIVLRSSAPVSPGGKGKAVNVVQPSTPFALTVIPKQVATLSVTPPNPTAKLGNQVELVVKVARQYDFDGPFKVELILPPGTQGVSADPITIPAGANEAKLLVRVATAAPPGNRPNLTIRAVATFNGNIPLTHETKINLNITK